MRLIAGLLVFLPFTALADDVANIAKISETAGKTAEKIDNIADAAKTVKNTADNISKVEHNALTSPVKGGSYSQVKMLMLALVEKRIICQQNLLVEYLNQKVQQFI